MTWVEWRRQEAVALITPRRLSIGAHALVSVRWVGDPVVLGSLLWSIEPRQEEGERFSLSCHENGCVLRRRWPFVRFPRLEEWILFPMTLLKPRNFFAERKIMAQFVKSAKSQKTVAENLPVPDDKVLFNNRPALEEYMSLCVVEGGELREPSVIMVGLGDDGVRVGIKDDGQGGWCWRQGATFGKALDALEKALATGEATFRSAGGRKPGKK